MEENKIDVLKAIVMENFAFTWGKMYYYPEIPEKILAKLIKHFDPYLNTNNIVAFCDSTLSRNAKNGIIFTLNGIYQQDLFEKPVYINYKDISSTNIIPNKKGEINATDTKVEISYWTKKGLRKLTVTTSYDKPKLKHTLDKLATQYAKWDDVITFKASGEVGSVELTDSQKKKCNTIIHTASVAAGGVGTGLAQIPLSDNAIITPIQITMIVGLAAVFDIRLTEGAAKGILAGFATSFVGRGISQVLFGWIPGLGNAINTATAAGITEAVGWMAVAHFFSLQQNDKAKYKIDGMKEGYTQASEEYEVKLRKQAKEFINQQKSFAKEKDAYEQLISEYETYISQLEEKLKKLENQNDTGYTELQVHIKDVKADYDQLVKLSA
ncbi:MAG: hypothetical protein IIX14_05610 [Clostridia bacterium]|nr:hypothetical protein [Clostridia bacterium]